MYANIQSCNVQSLEELFKTRCRMWQGRSVQNLTVGHWVRVTLRSITRAKNTDVFIILAIKEDCPRM